MEVQKLVKIVSEGLKILAQGVEAFAERVIDRAKDKSAAAAQSKKPSVSLKSLQGEGQSAAEAKAPAPGAAEPVVKKAAEPVEKKATEPAPKKGSGPAKKKTVKTAKKKTAKPVTAMATVLNIIGSSKTGVNTATISDKTGFERKKVSNIVYKLKKQGKITAVKKGTYVKS
jgi:hypothetical protein